MSQIISEREALMSKTYSTLKDTKDLHNFLKEQIVSKKKH